MRKDLFLLTVTIFIAFSSFSQDQEACGTHFHSQFDFWLGEWAVFDTSGTQIGENTITKLEKGCLINEHWRATQGGTGRSYNYFNKTDSTWNQVWVDSFGSNLVLKGKADPDKMTLRSELIPGRKVDHYYNQITWSKKDDGSVSQLWEIFDEQHKLLNIAFYGIYKRK